MIQAKKSALFERVFALYLMPSIHRSFSHLYGRNIRPPKGPALIISNHSSWWDGLLFFFLNRRVWNLDVHIMMHERGLKEFPFSAGSAPFQSTGATQKIFWLRCAMLRIY